MLGRYFEAIEIWEAIEKEHPYNKRVLEAINAARVADQCFVAEL